VTSAWTRALAAITPTRSLSIEFATARHDQDARRWLMRFAGRAISDTGATSVAVMAAAGCDTALGFDRDFEVAGFRLWPVGP
jgi:predicted nucleic acid-binding protein